MVTFAPNGAWLGTDPVESKTNYGDVLPGFHLRYAVTPTANVRFAVTRRAAELLRHDSLRGRQRAGRLGNPDLEPTVVERGRAVRACFKSVGVMSAGVFYRA